MVQGYPMRMRPQNLQERLMLCAQFEALERCQQVQCEGGVDSDKLTVKDDNDDDAEDAGDPQGNRLSLRQESARPLWTCSRESFSSARDSQNPSTMTK
jgi:hypothetical protein